MKYIMFSITIGSIQFKVPIIFPNNLVHSEIAQAMLPVFQRHFGECSPVVISAGDYDPIDSVCYGKSETLKVSASPDDGKIILTYAYTHGV
jgi:hypothetical protein